jgi:hypothetical protein
MKYLWVDPPNGYIFGFPKVVQVDLLDEFTDWDLILIQNGYPADKRESVPVKMWEATEDDVVNATLTTLNKTD